MSLTCTLNFQRLPIGIPGIGPKWLEGTIVHCFVRPTQAIPFPQSLLQPCFFEIMLAFFLESRIFSPALITSEQSVLQLGQYLCTQDKTKITSVVAHTEL